MHGNNGNQKKSDRVVKGGGSIDVSKLDPRRVDDFTERIKLEEERRKRNESSSSKSGGQSSSRF